MLRQIETWKFIENALQKNRDVILLYVLESKGSSPGRSGFFMAVDEQHEMSGSIGGGMMEHKLVELAKDLLKNLTQAQLVKRQIHDKIAPKYQSGMICSGEQTVLLYKITELDWPAIRNILNILQENGNPILQLSPNGLQCLDKIAFADIDRQYDYFSDDNWLYEEKLGYKNKLFIIGGGHCALAFSRLMQSLDFYVSLYENRFQLNTFLQNNFVHQKIMVENYAQLAELIPASKQHYVVIMTFGYRTDSIALRALLDKSFGYLGMLGSRAKINQLFDELRIEGIDEKIIQRINAPAGISIKSQTPEEIAISIAAQIIAVKNNAFDGKVV